MWAALLLPETAAVDAWPVVRILLFFVLLPLLVGAMLRRTRVPGWAAVLCARVAMVGLLVAVVLAIANDHAALLDRDAARVPLAAPAATRTCGGRRCS